MRGLHDEAVEAEDELAALRVDQPGSRHVGVRPQHLGIEIGKESLGCDERPLELGDAMDLEIADTRRLHACLRIPDRSMKWLSVAAAWLCASHGGLVVPPMSVHNDFFRVW